MNAMTKADDTSTSNHHSPSCIFYIFRTLNRFGCLVITFGFLSGCGIWRETPTSRTEIVPADIHEADEVRTIDISYRVTGIDAIEHRQVRERYLSTIAEEFESCGYILKEMPWASQIGAHVKMQVELEHEAGVVLLVLGFLTFGFIPEVGDDLTIITVHAYVGPTMKTYQERILVRTSRWCPLLCYIRPSYPAIAKEACGGMQEALRLIMRHMRDDQMLASPNQPVPPQGDQPAPN